MVKYYVIRLFIKKFKDMKKILFLISVVALVLSMSSCQKEHVLGCWGCSCYDGYNSYNDLCTCECHYNDPNNRHTQLRWHDCNHGNCNHPEHQKQNNGGKSCNGCSCYKYANSYNDLCTCNCHYNDPNNRHTQLRWAEEGRDSNGNINNGNGNNNNSGNGNGTGSIGEENPPVCEHGHPHCAGGCEAPF